MRSVSETISKNSSYTVLIVEDIVEQIVENSAESRLVNPGLYREYLLADPNCRYTVLESDSATAAALVCRGASVDGVLVNSVLQLTTGLEFIQELQNCLADYRPPVVIVSSESDPATIVRAIKQGAEDYLVLQTLTPEQLQFSMRSAIENARLRLQLQHQKERLRVSVENMLDCFGSFSAIRDEQGKIVDFRIEYLNKAACEINRMTREMQVGKKLCDLLPAHRETGLFDEYCRVVETGEPLFKESLVYEDDYAGQRLVRAFDIRATKLDDGFVASWRDVSDRKQLELELSQRLADLQQQQHRLQRLIDAAPIGIGIGMANGEVKTINDEMLRLHGYTREAFEQQGLNWRDFALPEQAAQIEAAMLELRQAGILPPEEKELVRRDGSRQPIWISVMQWQDGTDEHVAFAIDISQRKQAEAAVQRLNRELSDRVSELQTLIEIAPVGIAIATDPSCRQMQHNAYLRHLLGVSPGQNISKSAPPEEQPAFRVLQNGQEVAVEDLPMQLAARLGVEGRDTEMEIVLPDGRVRYLLVYASPVRDTQNQIKGAIGAFLDITERKAIEAEREQLLQQLQTERSFLEQTLQQMPSGVVIAEAPSGKLLFANDEAARLFRHPLREADTYEGYVQYGGIHADGRPYQPEEYPVARSVLFGEVIKGEELIYRRGDGTETILSINAAPILDANGQRIAVAATFEDIQARKQAEQDRILLAQIVESSNDAIIGFTLEQKVMSWNAGAERIFGYTSAEVLGQDVAILIPIDRLNELTLALQTIRQDGAVNPYETQRQRKDGSLVDVAITVSPIKTTTGEVIGVSATVRDMTLRKQLEQERERLLAEAQMAREAAEAANRSKDDFVSLVAHELRSPLNAILGWTKLLQTRQLDPATAKRALETIARNTQVQAQLVDDLLDASRVVRGTLKLEFAPVSLVNVVEAAIETVRPDAEAKAIQLKAQIDPVNIIRGDFNRLQQVALNLLTNAIKFTPSGGEISILLDLYKVQDNVHQDHAQIRLQVSDTGKGIAPEFLPHIFDRFCQDPQPLTQKQGLGLGLAIVKYIVERHGGTITAHSAGEGQGATFTVILPLAQ
jgi:PAS domain S-box-containing protein